MLTTILTGVLILIFCMEIINRYRYIFPVNWQKKWHVQDKIEVTQKKMWDLEFLKEKMKAMKEGFRMQYDRLKEESDAALLRTNVEKEKQEKADKKIISNLDNLVSHHGKDIGQLKQQMDGIDSQINGELNEETGQMVGIDPSIDGFRTVVSLLKEYKKKL